jgi:hypothetical protein
VAPDNRPPHELTRAELRARFIRRARKILRDAEEAIAVGEWWAENRTDCAPLDFEWARLHRADALQLLAQLGVEP